MTRSPLSVSVAVALLVAVGWAVPCAAKVAAVEKDGAGPSSPFPPPLLRNMPKGLRPGPDDTDLPRTRRPFHGTTPTALDEYVYKDDGAFSVRDVNISFSGDGYTAHVYNITSQRWLRPEDSTMHIWWHLMTVIIPNNVDPTLTSAFFYITGKHNKADFIPSAKADDVFLTAQIAMGARSVAAVLFQVPCEPITFPADPWAVPDRREDGIVAYTWWHYAMRNRSAPEWILEFPMAKAGVKALDALEHHIFPSLLPTKGLSTPITKFIVAGASKRGWAAWLVAAVEAIRPVNRVIGLIPMVLDAVDLDSFMRRQFSHLGAWSFALSDFVDCNITRMIGSAPLIEIFELVDMWYYLDRLTMPKLVVSAGGDQMQMPDSHRHFARHLPGDSHFLLVKNAEHSLSSGVLTVITSGISFLASVQRDAAAAAALLASPPPQQEDAAPPPRRPTVDWQIDEATGRLFVTTSEPPLSVNLTYSDSGLGVSAGRRDFRWGAMGIEPCKPTLSGCLRPLEWHTEGLENVVVTSPTSFSALVTAPAGQWRVFTLEFVFKNPDSLLPFIFTAPASVVPVTVPFAPCVGDCGTTIV